MNETELERIVVRLVGDGSSYQQMMTTAAQSAHDTAQKVGESANKIEHFRTALTGFAGQALGMLGAFGIASSLQGAFEGFSKFEEGQIRLRNIITATGQNLETTMAGFNRFTKTITETTNVTKGETLALLQRATAMGLNAAQAEKVTRNAIALAGITGRDEAGMIRIAAAIERGNYQMARRVLGLQGVKDETELVRIVNNMMTAGMQTQIEFAETAAGRLERLGRSLKFVGVEIGGIVANAIMPFVKGVQYLIDQFKALDPFTKQATTAIVGFAIGMRAIGPTIAGLHMALGPLFPLLQHLPKMMLGPWGLVAAGIALIVTKLGGVEATWNLVKEAAMSAWEKIKESVMGFWEWAQPIFRAIGYAGMAAWDLVIIATVGLWNAVRPIFVAIGTFVGGIFRSMFGDVQVNWTKIKDFIVTVIIGIEYFMGRVGRVWSLITTDMSIAFAKFAKNVTTGETSRMFLAMQRQMEQERRAISRSGNESFQDFYNRRLADINRQSAPVVAAAEAVGEQIGGAMAHGVEKTHQKLEAALRFSAEAVGRINDYVANLQGERRGDGEAGRVFPVLAGGGNPLDAETLNRQRIANMVREGDARQSRRSMARVRSDAIDALPIGSASVDGQLPLLQRIAIAIEQVARNPSVRVEAAALGGS